MDIIAVLAFNDPFVMSAWGKVNGVRDSIVSANGFATFDQLLTFIESSSFPTLMPSSPRALDGLMPPRGALAGMLLSLTTARLVMPRSRPSGVPSR